MFPRKLLLLTIDFLFKNKATVLAPAGSPISNTILIDATRLELKFTDPGSTSILNLYGARVGCPAWAVFVFAVLPPWGPPIVGVSARIWQHHGLPC